MTEFSEDGLDELWQNAQRIPVKGTPRFRHYREWAVVCAQMEKRLGRGEFRAMMGTATIESVAGGAVIIALSSRMLRDWCNSRYAPIMLADWTAENRKIRTLNFTVTSKSTHPVSMVPARTPIRGALP